MTRHQNPDDAPTLFDAPPVYVRPPFTPQASLEDRFAAFHQANPWVVTALYRLALDLVNHGQTRLGVGHLFEVLRYRLMRDGSVGEGTKAMPLNNSYRSRYARLLVQMDPRLDGVFELRKMPTEVSA